MTFARRLAIVLCAVAAMYFGAGSAEACGSCSGSRWYSYGHYPYHYHYHDHYKHHAHHYDCGCHHSYRRASYREVHRGHYHSHHHHHHHHHHRRSSSWCW